jgi:hypothetical protein
MKHIIKGYLRNWPRQIFGMSKQDRTKTGVREILHHPGVYILYDRRIPYYIGRTDHTLWGRIYGHARNSSTRYFNFWDNFSAFIIEDERDRVRVEGILIAAMPSANGAQPRLHRISLPGVAMDWLRKHHPTIL